MRLHYIISVMLLIVVSGFHLNPVLAEDIILIAKPQSSTDERLVYVTALLKEALKKTIPEYGEYRIEHTLSAASRDRALFELISGKNINVHMAATQITWEEKTIPVRIPILKGLLGYRLFFIKKQNIEKFSKINTVEQLQKLKAGLHQQWSITKTMKSNGFNVVEGSNYEGLFHMLAFGRFDYFPRGVSEIFSEFKNHVENFPDLSIDTSKALYLPLPNYVFVSPKFPRLAKRIEKGFLLMIEDGSFDKIFLTFNEQFIQKAKLAERQIFNIDNDQLSPETPLNRDDLWFDPMQ